MSQKRQTVIATPEDMRARAGDIDKEEKAGIEALERAKRNKDFVQLSKAALTPLRGLMDRSPSAVRILLSMVENMGHQENALQVSIRVIGEMSGASPATVRREIKRLKIEKWIESVGGVKDVYRVNSTVFWMSYGDRKDGSFQATLAIPKVEKGIKINAKVTKKMMPVVAIKAPKAPKPKPKKE